MLRRINVRIIGLIDDFSSSELIDSLHLKIILFISFNVFQEINSMASKKLLTLKYRLVCINIKSLYEKLHIFISSSAFIDIKIIEAIS